MVFSREGTGFTLVEVMVAMTIFLIASMGLLPLLLTNIHTNQELNLHARARHLASEAMAGLQLVEYSSLDAFSGLDLSTGNIDVRPQIERNMPARGQSRITITARWQLKGDTHSYRLQTIRSAP